MSKYRNNSIHVAQTIKYFLQSFPHSVARSYRRSFIETTVGARPNTLYAQRLFTAWDFTITSPKAAALKHAHIHTELREMLADCRTPHAPRTALQRALRCAHQALVHAAAAAAIAAVAYALWLLLQLLDEQPPTGGRLAAMYVAAAACGTLAVLQAAFAALARLEPGRSARGRVHRTLVRTFGLQLAIGGVLLVYWLVRKDGEDVDNGGGAPRPCWETQIGQELWRLVWVDFAVSVVGAWLWAAGRWALWRWMWPAVGRPEFDLARGSLGLVFDQSLVWLGMLWSPALVAVVAAKMAVTFYARESALMWFCRPVARPWRGAQMRTVVLGMVFVALVLVVMVNGFVVTR